MKTTFILITSQNPFHCEFSDFFLKPEKDKSLYVIKLISSTRPEPRGDSMILNDEYNIEILDESSRAAAIKINHLCLTKIVYDYKTHYITFSIDEGLKVFSQPVNIKRTNPEIRIDIQKGIEKITLIPTNTSIATIFELQI
jgi:hypothetical protein